MLPMYSLFLATRVSKIFPLFPPSPFSYDSFELILSTNLVLVDLVEIVSLYGADISTCVI
jgi:hypothetical protein